MLPVETLAMFFGASVLLALSPGPDILFVLAQAVQRGRRAGLTVTIGLCTGLLVHTTAVAFGVAAIFKASELAFSLVKYIGAAYLLYIAYHAFTAASNAGAEQSVPEMAFGRLYRRGIIMNITNPKVSLFFLAFLPQFTDPAYGPMLPQFLLLGFLFIVSTILVFGGVSIQIGRAHV
jgi:threonine/homoserine/homoserine lactone efflux protein